MSKFNTDESRTLSIRKQFDAPVKLVWEVWTKPEHLVQWWAPKGIPITVIEHDFRMGGKWKYSMPMPDGSAFLSEGTYLEVDPFKRIVTTADFKPMTENVELHVLFEEDGDKTLFTFSVVHATEEYKMQQEKMGFYNGWGSALQRMESLLRALTEKVS
jgi:uncharacterized protein YndB with AHSA1/START domain